MNSADMINTCIASQDEVSPCEIGDDGANGTATNSTTAGGSAAADSPAAGRAARATADSTAGGSAAADGTVADGAAADGTAANGTANSQTTADNAEDSDDDMLPGKVADNVVTPKQKELRRQFREKAQMPVVEAIAERLEKLELGGIPVIVYGTTDNPGAGVARTGSGVRLSQSIPDVLHWQLKELDPDYDRKYSAKKDLSKMKVLAALLADPKHCFDSKYLFELYSCGDPACPYGCAAWPVAAEGSAEAALQAEIKQPTRLPRMGPDGEHFLPYKETCELCENDERDLPSTKKEAPKALLDQKKALDKQQKGLFVNSKMRDAICCVECGRPRVIYSMKKPTGKKLLQALDAYKEGIDYQCGASLFDSDEVAESGDKTLKELASTFHVRQALTCRDDVEESYFNFNNVRGCVDLEWVCAICGAGPDESPLDPTTCGGGDVSGYTGFAMKAGQMMLPICLGCQKQNKKSPLVGTAKQVEKERERQEAKRAEKECQAKGGAKGKMPAARPPPADEEEGEEDVGEAGAMDEDEAAETPQRGGGGGGGGGGGSSSGASARGEKRGRPAPTPGSLSSSSGAAKKRAKVAAAAAAANPPTLSELIEAALLDFRQRGQRLFYRSMLRAVVMRLDPMKPARKFGDRAAWETALNQLHTDGKLIYEAAGDNIRLPEAAGPSSAPA